jgi:hypothetical protein
MFVITENEEQKTASHQLRETVSFFGDFGYGAFNLAVTSSQFFGS